MKAYINKIEKIRLEQEAKEISKKEIERKKREREQQAKVKTSGGVQKKRVKYKKEEVNVGPAQMPRSIRNVRQPARYIDGSDSEEVLGDESTDEEDLTCQQCLNDDHDIAADYVGCDTCERWFHKKCAKMSELDVFSYKFC